MTPPLPNSGDNKQRPQGGASSPGEHRQGSYRDGGGSLPPAAPPDSRRSAPPSKALPPLSAPPQRSQRRGLPASAPREGQQKKPIPQSSASDNSFERSSPKPPLRPSYRVEENIQKSSVDSSDVDDFFEPDTETDFEPIGYDEQEYFETARNDEFGEENDSSNIEDPPREEQARGRRASQAPARAPETASLRKKRFDGRETTQRPLSASGAQGTASQKAVSQQGIKEYLEPEGKNNKPRPNFIDDKKMTLEPYGRKKGSAYLADVDKRANLRKKAAFVQIGALGLLGVLVALGVKNAIIPPDTLSEEEVAAVVASQTGATGFPSERGQGFATDFISAWAQRDDSTVREAALSYFYGGEEQTEGDTMETLGDFRQDIVYGPTVYEVNPISAYSENYIIGVGVSVSDSMVGVPLEIEEGVPNLQWRFFSVDVYRDGASDAISIAPGSPSLVPPYTVGSAAEAPIGLNPGTGTEDSTLTEASRTTVEGFMSGFANASPDDLSGIEQYISDGFEPDPVYLDVGMSGQVELDGTPAEAISHTVYYIEPEDTSYVAARVNVRWRDPSATGVSGDSVIDGSTDDEETGAVYTASYNMRLVQSSEGVWTVAGLWPMYYSPDFEESGITPE